MRLEDLSIAVRPRNHFEAGDLGFLMLRRWWRDVYVAWLVATVPIVAAACLLLREHPALIGIAVWWFKPFYDRVMLHVLGARVFGARTDFKALAKFIPTTLKPDLLVHLTIGRILLSRSFRLPVITLEGLRGAAYRARFKTLRQKVQGRAQTLTVVCAHLEAFLVLGLLGFTFLLVPPTVELDLLELYRDGPKSFQYAQSFAWYAAMSIIEPAYVASGFALYLNRRTLLEGWDLELGLRRMSRRRAKSRRPAARAAAVVVAACVAGLMAAPPETRAQANDEDPDWYAEPRPAGDARAVAREVLSHEDFATSRTVTRWFGAPDEDDDELRSPTVSAEFWTGVASAIKAIAWAVVIAGGLWALYKLAPLLQGARLRRTQAPPAAELGYGEDVAPEPLGNRIAERAAHAWREGRRREGLSLLYRGAVEQLVDEHRLRVPEGATEGDLLEIVRARAPAEVLSMLTVLLRAWQALVYANREVADRDFETILASWRAAMGERA